MRHLNNLGNGFSITCIPPKQSVGALRTNDQFLNYFEEHCGIVIP